MLASMLFAWLPKVIPGVRTWMSDKNIHVGSHWSSQVHEELKTTDLGVICLTPENLEAPWVLFEAGALSQKRLCCIYLLGADLPVIPGPLKMFQATKADREGTYRLVHSISETLEYKIPESSLEALFDRFWPELDEKIAELERQGQSYSSIPKQSLSKKLEPRIDPRRPLPGCRGQKCAVTGTRTSIASANPPDPRSLHERQAKFFRFLVDYTKEDRLRQRQSVLPVRSPDFVAHRPWQNTSVTSQAPPCGPRVTDEAG